MHNCHEPATSKVNPLHSIWSLRSTAGMLKYNWYTKQHNKSDT